MSRGLAVVTCQPLGTCSAIVYWPAVMQFDKNNPLLFVVAWKFTGPETLNTNPGNGDSPCSQMPLLFVSLNLNIFKNPHGIVVVVVVLVVVVVVVVVAGICLSPKRTSDSRLAITSAVCGLFVVTSQPLGSCSVTAYWPVSMQPETCRPLLFVTA